MSFIKLLFTSTKSKENSSFSDLEFSRDGHFDVSPYCVTIQAQEVIKGKKMIENATVCVFSPEPIPVPMRLRDEKSWKAKKVNSNPASTEVLKVSSTLKFVLEYPEFVEVLQNASDYARIVEPVKPINDKQIK